VLLLRVGSRAVAIATPLFLKYIIDEAGQGLLADPARWEAVLNALPAKPVDLRESIESKWMEKGLTSLQRWEILQTEIRRALETLRSKLSLPVHMKPRREAGAGGGGRGLGGWGRRGAGGSGPAWDSVAALCGWPQSLSFTRVASS
jgi:hypothetical protein